jgi:integrase
VLAAGKSIYWLSTQLGHSSIQVTEQRYAQLEAAEKAKAAADLADKFAA